MQRRPTVAARGGLPVPLLGLGPGTVVVPDVALGNQPAVERAGQPVGRLAVPPLGGDPHPLLGARVPAVLQQVGERVGAQSVPLLGGLAQPVLCGGLVAPLTVVASQRVRGRGGSGDGGDPPPAGGVLGVTALVQQDTQVVGGGPVARGGGGTQMGLGSVEVTAAQQEGTEDAHRLDVTALRGKELTCLLGSLPGFVPVHGLRQVARRLRKIGRLHKTPCLQQSCLVPHNVHRRTTCNLGTPGIPQPVRSLQRFVDMPTERQVKHGYPQLPEAARPSHRSAHAFAHHEGPDPQEDPGLRFQ